MPPLFIEAGLRFFFVMFDLLNEPFHLHVGDGNRKLCKYWIFADGSIELADSKGIKKRELKDIKATLVTQMTLIQESWSLLQKNNITINYKIKRSA